MTSNSDIRLPYAKNRVLTQLIILFFAILITISQATKTGFDAVLITCIIVLTLVLMCIAYLLLIPMLRKKDALVLSPTALIDNTLRRTFCWADVLEVKPSKSKSSYFIALQVTDPEKYGPRTLVGKLFKSYMYNKHGSNVLISTKPAGVPAVIVARLINDYREGLTTAL